MRAREGREVEMESEIGSGTGMEDREERGMGRGVKEWSYKQADMQAKR